MKIHLSILLILTWACGYSQVPPNYNALPGKTYCGDSLYLRKTFIIKGLTPNSYLMTGPNGVVQEAGTPRTGAPRLAATQIAYGSPTDTITSTANLIWNNTQRSFQAGDLSGVNNKTKLVVNDFADATWIDANDTGGVGLYIDGSVTTSYLGTGSAQNANLCLVEVANSPGTRYARMGNVGGGAKGNGTILTVDDLNSRYNLTKLAGVGDGVVGIHSNGDLFLTSGSVGPTGPTGDTGPTGADGSLNAWGLTGNAGTDPTINYLGTLDNVPLSIRIGNSAYGQFNALTSNLSLGQISLVAENTGTQNCVYGDFALSADTGGNGNVAIGYAALQNSKRCNYSVVIGFQAEAASETGLNNVAIGANSGVSYPNNADTNCTYIGASAISQGNFKNSTAIGATSQITSDNEMVFGYQVSKWVINGVLDTMPFSYGAPGSVLTDVTGAGSLEWQTVPSSFNPNACNDSLNAAYLNSCSDIIELTAHTVTVPVGNVGIGTKTPTVPLYTKGSVIISDVDDIISQDQILLISSTSNTTSALLTVSSPTHTGLLVGNDNSQILATDFSVGIGTATPSGKLNVIGDSIVFGNDGEHNLTFRYPIGGSGQAGWGIQGKINGAYNDLSINADGGNVGIGTTTPTAKLEVAGSFYAGTNNSFVTTDGTDVVIGDAFSTGNATAIDVQDGVSSITINNAGTTAFTGDGNVGIGQPNPTAKLHVVGSTTIDLTGGNNFYMNLPAFDDDAAAGVGGLTTGQWYQTTGSAILLPVAGVAMIKQ